MEDKNSVPEWTATTSYTILHQYLRDLSFEAPNVHVLFGEENKEADLNFNVNVEVNTLTDSEDRRVFEVSLKLSLTSQTKETEVVLFVLEMAYNAVVAVEVTVPEEALKLILSQEVPHLIFPEVRYLVSRSTQEGGFPPVVLTPLDFRNLKSVNDRLH